ncbi:hypothetical protein GCM10020360_04130 [Nonlabens tegetincola]
MCGGTVNKVGARALTAAVIVFLSGVGAGASPAAAQEIGVPAAAPEALFTVTPERLVATTAVGSEETRTATLVANRPLRLTGTSGGAGSDTETTRSFSEGCPAGWFGSRTMQAGDTCELTWTTHPTKLQSLSQGVSFTAQELDAAGTPVGEPTLSSFALELTSAALEFNPAVAHGEVPVGRNSSETLRLTNRASVDALVTLSNFSGPFAVDERLLVQELRVPARGSLDIAVDFRPLEQGALTGSADLSYRLDNGSTERRSSYLRFSGVGTDEQPPVTVTAPPVDFGTVRVGQAVERTLTLTNTGVDEVAIETVNAAALQRLGITLGELPDYGYIGRGDSIEVPVTWAPKTAGKLAQQATFNAFRLMPARAMAEDPPGDIVVTVALSGTATEPTPPIDTGDGGDTGGTGDTGQTARPVPHAPTALASTGGGAAMAGWGVALMLLLAGGAAAALGLRKRG